MGAEIKRTGRQTLPCLSSARAKMVVPSATLILVTCILWCLALVAAEHYKFILEAETPELARKFTKFVVTFEGAAGKLQHKAFTANKSGDNNVFELPESQCPEGASIFHINAYYSGDGFIGVFPKEFVGVKPNEEGITVVELTYSGAVACQKGYESGWPYVVGQIYDLERIRKALKSEKIHQAYRARIA